MSNYKKLFVIILSLSYLAQMSMSKSWSESTREFWVSFFGVIKGKDFKIDIDCLSGKFDIYLDNLNKALENSDITQIVSDINYIYYLEAEKCPIEEYNNIIKDFRIASDNGMLIKNGMKNFSVIKDKVNKYLDSHKSPCAFGILIGELTKILTYGMSFTSWKDPHGENGEINLQFLN